MPFHFCSDELLMILAMIPFIGIFFTKIHNWWHLKFGHKCHEKGCGSKHVEHYNPYDKKHWHQPEQVTAEDANLLSNKESYSLTLRGIVVGTVIFNHPMTHEQVVAMLPREKVDEVYAVIKELLDEGALVLDGDLLKEGNIFHDPQGSR